MAILRGGRLVTAPSADENMDITRAVADEETQMIFQRQRVMNSILEDADSTRAIFERVKNKEAGGSCFLSCDLRGSSQSPSEMTGFSTMDISMYPSSPAADDTMSIMNRIRKFDNRSVLTNETDMDITAAVRIL